MSLLTDAALDAEVTAAIAGDRDAFARLVAATSSLVTAITLSETRDVELARDAAQDVYLQVWGGLGALRQPGSFLPWLRTAARRQARRLSLQRARRAGGREAEAALEQAADAAPGPGERLLDAERAALVRSALEALPDEARETLILYYREGHSSAQVGRLLGLSDAAVQQRLSRARSKVREEVLARLGEALVQTAPAAGFTAAVVALLLPRTAAAAGVQAAGGLLAALQVPKAAIAAAVALLAALGAFLVLRGPPGPGGGGPPTVTIARPAGERPPSEPPRETPRAEAPPVADERIEVTVLAQGAPRAGAMVRLYRRVTLEPVTGRPAWRRWSEATTGTGGVAVLSAAPGAWLVSARADGFAPALHFLFKASGERITAARLELEATATLAGRTVANRGGEPVALATLTLTRELGPGAPDADLPVEERLGAVSDARGQFTFHDVVPGSYTLVAEAPGHARTVLPGLDWPRSGPLEVRLRSAGVIEGVALGGDGRPAAGASVTFAGGPELVQVESGPSGGFAAEVAPGNYQVSAVRGSEAGWLPRGLAVGPGETLRGQVVRLATAAGFMGRITDSNGQAVGGALVSVASSGAPGEVARTLSDPGGHFLLAPLAPGAYVLHAEAESFTARVRPGLVLLPSQRFELSIALDGVGAIEGRVTDGNGRPLGEARVLASRVRTPLEESREAEAVSGTDGRYRLGGLMAGSYQVRARRPSSTFGVPQDLALDPGKTASADFALPALGTVEGQVVRADGKPLAGRLSVDYWPQLPITQPRDRSRTLTDERGRFSLALPPGAWRLSVDDDGPAASVSLSLNMPSADVTVEAARAVRVEMVIGEADDSVSSSQLELTVLEPGGAPSQRAIFQMENRGRPMVMMARTDEAGHAVAGFAIRSPGSKSADAWFASARRGPRVAPPQPVPSDAKAITLQLLPGSSLHGRVTDPGGSPVTSFTLRLEETPESPRRPGRSTTWEFTGDLFDLPEVPSDALTLKVTTSDGRTGTARVETTPGGAAEVGVQLTGRVEPGDQPADLHQ